MSTKRMGILAVIIATLLFTGCSGTSGLEEPVVTGANEEGDVTSYEFQVINTQEHDVAAYVHGDHWHGGIPWIKEGDHVLLAAYIEDPEGNIVDVDGSRSRYAVNAQLMEGCKVVSFECYGDYFHLAGEEVGETQIVLQLLQEGEVVYETPPIRVRVIDNEEE